MPKDRAPSYTPAPAHPTDPVVQQRFDQVIAVLSEQETMTGAARSLALSRNHFQTLFHRVLAAMIDALTPKPAGRPAKPAREVELEAENARLRAENSKLQARAETVERLLDLVGGIASGREALTRHTKKRAPKPDEDPEPATGPTATVTTVLETQAPTRLRARALGVSESTVHRRRRQTSPRRPRATKPCDAVQANAVRELVRTTHGLAGATGLSKITGVSRRQAASIKAHELAAMERERKTRCASVDVPQPGVIRGFDAMHMSCVDGPSYWLIAADAALPYRTSVATVNAYDAANVIAALTADFELHGPPLVLRLDRAASQRTPDVLALLARYEVLPLHGPPRHPQYYGQLERQNREHRAWLDPLGPLTRSVLPDVAATMKTALNALWARPTLDWCTAQQRWDQRTTIQVDRADLRRDVVRRVDTLVSQGIESTLAQRRATEAALIDRGLLCINFGGRR